MYFIALPYLVLYLAYAPLPLISRFGKYGDFSYGLYIFSFPVQQLLMHWTDGQLPLIPFMLLGFAASLALAVLSWHLVESPALRLKRYLPRAASAPSTTGAASLNR